MNTFKKITDAIECRRCGAVKYINLIIGLLLIHLLIWGLAMLASV